MSYGFVLSLAAFLFSDWQIINRLLCVTRAFSILQQLFNPTKEVAKLLSSSILSILLTTQVERRKPKSLTYTPFRSLETVPQRPDDAPLNRAPLPHCFGLWYSTRNNHRPSRCPHALGQTAYQRFRCRLHECLQHASYRLLQLRLRGAGLLKQMHRLPRQSANYHDSKLRRHECLRQYINRAILSRPRCPYALLQRS